jgi:plastocyanin
VTYPTATTATLTAALSLRDSLWVVAETPTHLRDSTRVHLLPQPAQLVKVSGDGQSGVVRTALNALVVRVLDALGGGFKGDTVRWLVTPSSSALLSAPATVTDSTGYASMIVTPTGVGPLTIQAGAQPIGGAIAQSPATFTAQVLALPPPPPPPPVAVRMVAPTTFLPAVVTVVRGQSVVWTNGDVIGHTTTSDTKGIWDSQTVPPGQTFSFTFTTAGTYTYHCTIHPTLMIGTVVVQ